MISAASNGIFHGKPHRFALPSTLDTIELTSITQAKRFCFTVSESIAAKIPIHVLLVLLDPGLPVRVDPQEPALNYRCDH